MRGGDYSVYNNNVLYSSYTDGGVLNYRGMRFIFGGVSGSLDPTPTSTPTPRATPPASPIEINIPIEIDAGDYAVALTAQGEVVSYSKVHIPLKYETSAAASDPSAASVGAAIRYKEDVDDQTKVDVTVYNETTVKDLFKAALDGSSLTWSGMTDGVVDSSGSTRNMTSDPLKYYVDKATHNLHSVAGSPDTRNLEAYLREYLYDNLKAAIGLAATSGDIDITMSRKIDNDDIDVSEIVSDALIKKLSPPANAEAAVVVAAKALRQNIYEQMFTLAPARFAAMNETNALEKPLPFIKDDSLAFLVTFKFPGSSISAPVFANKLDVADSNVAVLTGSKIDVKTQAPASNIVFNDFPHCTVMMRTVLKY